MSFTIQEYAHQRPYLYHVTAKPNLAALRRSRVLYSAAALAKLAENPAVISERRRDCAPVMAPFGSVSLRDQAPLHVANVAFESGWDGPRLLEQLASHVFFWPGSPLRPIDYGRRHFRKYRATDVVLRVPFNAIKSREPLFCKFNSGSPRCSHGRKSPRGPSTFLDAASCPFGPSAVVEVVFRWALPVPNGAEWSSKVEGPWKPLM